MTDQKKKLAKEKIFQSAVSLFAAKGYDGVGIREIARTAKVNVAMINYYYGSKFGILKEIIIQMKDKYYTAIAKGFDDKLTLEERIRLIIGNLIEFFRKYFELYWAGNNPPRTELKELINLELKLEENYHQTIDRFFNQVGININDHMLMSMVRGAISSLLIEHFRNRYLWEKVYKEPYQEIFKKAPPSDECEIEYNDAYYAQYADVLTRFYLDGIRGIIRSKNQKGDHDA